MPKNKSTHSRLLDEAMAEARTIRETAIENAKISLLEQFKPRIQSMISAKLAEEAEDEEDMLAPDGAEDEDALAVEMDGGDIPVEDDEEAIAEMDDEMGDEDDDISIAEMDGEDELEAPLDGEEGISEVDLDGEDEEFGDIEEEGEMPELDGEDELEESDEEDYEDEDDRKLDEIIRELDEEADSSEIGTADNKEPANSASDDTTEDPGKNQLVEGDDEDEDDEDVMAEADGDDEDEISIEEVVKAVRRRLFREEAEEASRPDAEDGHDENPPANDPRHITEEGGQDPDAEDAHEPVKGARNESRILRKRLKVSEQKLQEAYDVVQFMREEISRMNIMNTRLLYANRLFRKYDLNESQKHKVLENLDRTKTLREAKLVYATLAEAFKTARVKPLSESRKPRGGASKRVRGTATASSKASKGVILESEDLVAKMQRLANINKKK